MDIDYTVQIWREGSQFIAHAMPLDVASSGTTPQAARAALDEAVKLFIKTAKQHGTLTEVLETPVTNTTAHCGAAPTGLALKNIPQPWRLERHAQVHAS